MKVMAGIDLHSNNAMCGIVDSTGKRLLHKKVPCELPRVLEVLAPYKERLDTIAVESTFNWYWLVDGLQDHAYKVALANPAAMEQYNGLKHTDDKSDAFFLAELLRLQILPTAHIYDRKTRPVRDLLRRRLLLVHQRTSLLLSLKSLHARTTGQGLSQAKAKALEPEEAAKLFEHPAEQLIAREQAEHIGQLTKSIAAIEKLVIGEAKKSSGYAQLQTIPGVGRILALTITLETGDIQRFASAGDYASYCRTVDSKRLSNGKKKGENNAKCGNKYLEWAFVEAANFARRLDLPSRQFFDRKLAKTNRFVATKALACKLSKAAWHILSQKVSFDWKRVFPGRVVEIIRPEGKKQSQPEEAMNNQDKG
jgi:transposase